MLKFKVDLVQPIQVDTRSNNSLNYRRGLLLEQKYKILQIFDQANDSLDSKATQLLQAGGLIVALVTALSFSTFFASPGSTTSAKAGIAVACLAFVGMIGLSIAAWSPKESGAPGSLDWAQMYDRYILVDDETCYNQILSDCTEAIASSKAVNIRKGNLVKWSAFLLVLQLGGLVILALVR